MKLYCLTRKGLKNKDEMIGLIIQGIFVCFVLATWIIEWSS